jgi:hypothetical protein
VQGLQKVAPVQEYPVAHTVPGAVKPGHFQGLLGAVGRINLGLPVEICQAHADSPAAVPTSAPAETEASISEHSTAARSPALV